MGVSPNNKVWGSATDFPPPLPLKNPGYQMKSKCTLTGFASPRVWAVLCPGLRIRKEVALRLSQRLCRKLMVFRTDKKQSGFQVNSTVLLNIPQKNETQKSRNARWSQEGPRTTKDYKRKALNQVLHERTTLFCLLAFWVMLKWRSPTLRNVHFEYRKWSESQITLNSLWHASDFS